MKSGDHTRWSEQLPAYLLGALSPGEQSEIEHHLGGCAECQSELRWLDPVIEELAESVPQVQPPGDLKMRILAEVKAEAEASAALDMARPGQEPARTSTGFSFRNLFRPAVLAGVAATLFIGVVVGYAINGGSDSGTGLDGGTTITGKSDIGANAVLVRSGDSGTLKIADLKELDGDEVYQAWVQHGQAVVPTDSLFTPDRNGNATTSIPDLNGVSTIMISAEPKGGSKQPTTAPVVTIDLT